MGATTVPSGDARAGRPVSDRDPRDRLISSLVACVDVHVSDRAAHRAAMEQVRETLEALVGPPTPQTLWLQGNGALHELAHWYRLAGGWLGRRVGCDIDEFFSDRTRSPTAEQ